MVVRNICLVFVFVKRNYVFEGFVGVRSVIFSKSIQVDAVRIGEGTLIGKAPGCEGGGWFHEFQSAVENTGGKFYVRTDEHPVSEIVQDIQKQEAMMVKVVSSRENVDIPEAAFIMLLLGIIVFCGAGWVLQK